MVRSGNPPVQRIRLVTFLNASLRPALGVLAACLAAAAMTAPAHAADSYVQQVGTYDYLTQPDFDGLAPLRTAITGQTLGLGTFDHLDGEFVLVAGTPYRVSTDGTPTVVDPSISTPFAQAIDFHPDTSGPVAPGTTCANLGSAVTDLAGTTDGIIAVRVRGTFTNLLTRSVPRQDSPYPPLSQVVAGQTEFPLGEQRAVLVGFWQGDDMKGIGQPGLHLHGVTADREAGGHVLSCTLGGDIQLSVQRTDGVVVHSHR